MDHFISDLHLSPEKTHLTALFEHYVSNIAEEADQIFILGDFFEYWIGDDFENDYSRSIEQLLSKLSTKKPVFFMHGNRDFLIGESFARRTGCQLISEPWTFERAGKKICLAHGDALCTDDIAYQEFRNMVRNPQWQQQFLSQPLEHRLATAQSLRERSAMAQQNKTDEIMDVNEQSVIEFMQQQQCDVFIHGHTHRPAQHKIQFAKSSALRVVLSDWRDKGHYLSVDLEANIQSHYFDYR